MKKEGSKGGKEKIRAGGARGGPWAWPASTSAQPRAVQVFHSIPHTPDEDAPPEGGEDDRNPRASRRPHTPGGLDRSPALADARGSR